MKGNIPMSECMFKGTRDGKMHLRLKEHARRNGYPRWFSVSMSEKGSYREHDVVSFLKLESSIRAERNRNLEQESSIDEDVDEGKESKRAI